jgi:hypothetical protein
MPLGPRDDLTLSIIISAPRVSDGAVVTLSGSSSNGFSTEPIHGKRFALAHSDVYNRWKAGGDIFRL